MRARHALAVLFFSAIALPAGAADPACVVCQEPEAHYACALENSELPPGDIRVKLFCIAELARAGGHKSCAIERSEQKNCPGTVKTIKVPDLFPSEANAQNKEPAPSAVAKPAEPLANGDHQLPKPQQKSDGGNGEPKTVKELVEKSGDTAVEGLAKTEEAAGSAIKSAGGALGKAGEAVGSAAEKTWTCLTSLFSKC